MEINGIRVFETIPEGWRILDGATTAPRGYAWISNGKSHFGGEYQHALYKLPQEFSGDEDTEELPPEPAPEPTGTQEAGKVTLYQGEHHKWEIVKAGNDTYEVTFFEYAQGRDWFRLGQPDIYNREALEFEFAEFDLSALFGPPVTSDTEAAEEPQATQSIKFFWNGIKVNGEKKLIRCRYSLDNSTAVSVPCVTIYARDYSGELPGDLFSVRNDTDSYQDYFCPDEAVLDPAHPLYHYARAAAIKAELRNEKHYRAEKCDLIRQDHAEGYTGCGPLLPPGAGPEGREESAFCVPCLALWCWPGASGRNLNFCPCSFGEIRGNRET